MLGPEVLKAAPAGGGLSDDTLWRLETNGRVPVRLDVDIYCHGYLLGRRRATELSCEGLFVETPPLKLGRRAYLEVEFVLDLDGETRLYRLCAFVSGERPNGLELQFVDLRESLFRAVC
jgi:hypothetical protein